jgi:hypothetical protein
MSSRGDRKRRALTRRERKALEKFARLEISLEQLKEALGEMIEVSFAEDERRLVWHFVLPEPRVRVRLNHIHDAMAKHAREEITTKELSEWAAMLLLNEAYEWEGPEEDEIADWLNEISLLTLKPRKDLPSD